MMKTLEIAEETTISVIGGESKPPRVAPRIKAAPKIRQIFWCDFPDDAQIPEFWKRRPVVIISHRNTLSGAVTVVPCSAQDQGTNPWAVQLRTTIDGARSWAISDKLTTVAVSRLTPTKGAIPRLSEAEFNEILALILRWLPRLPAHRTVCEPLATKGHL